MRQLEIPYVSVFAITLCETQLSAEDRSFLLAASIKEMLTKCNEAGELGHLFS